MVDDFLIARNPEPGSKLPFLLRIPLGADGVLLKSREQWPRTSKVYCHRAEGWPDDAEIVERVAVKSCVKRGAAIDLILDRGRENRSQFVFTWARGREMIFWQTARVAKQARPNVRPTKAAAADVERFTITVDSHERYPWRFADLPVDTQRGPLVAGDYGVHLDGELIAAVERKSLDDLMTTLSTGKMSYLLAGLATLPRSAVVVEDRYSRIFESSFVKPSVLADSLGECQARFASVPIIFAETRPLAQQWAYRFLAACLVELGSASATDQRLAGLAGAPLISPEQGRADQQIADESVTASTAEIRAWAMRNGLPVADRGRLRPEIIAAYRQAQRS